MFWTIYQKLATQQQVSERISLLLLLCHFKRSVSKASQRNFGLSTGVVFASNDSKTFFEQRKNARWTETILWRQISDLSGQFSDHRSQIFLFKWQICRWHGPLTEKGL
jgi:hypothetical protein